MFIVLQQHLSGEGERGGCNHYYKFTVLVGGGILSRAPRMTCGDFYINRLRITVTVVLYWIFVELTFAY
jgi:hypothetical protein